MRRGAGHRLKFAERCGGNLIIGGGESDAWGKVVHLCGCRGREGYAAGMRFRIASGLWFPSRNRRGANGWSD